MEREGSKRETGFAAQLGRAGSCRVGRGRGLARPGGSGAPLRLGSARAGPGLAWAGLGGASEDDDDEEEEVAPKVPLLLPLLPKVKREILLSPQKGTLYPALSIRTSEIRDSIRVGHSAIAWSFVLASDDLSGLKRLNAVSSSTRVTER
ncbi:Protein of unknown function [Gryllus bimaculatus]|nr:Protein of unknown function [Gryllus bimaculatus]